MPWREPLSSCAHCAAWHLLSLASESLEEAVLWCLRGTRQMGFQRQPLLSFEILATYLASHGCILGGWYLPLGCWEGSWLAP